MIEQSRRGFITGLISLVAAPAIVRVGSLMPVKVIDPRIAIEELLRRRIAKAESMMIEHIKTCLFGDRVYGISGLSNLIYYEPVTSTRA